MAHKAFGTTLKWGTAAVAGLTSINGIEITVDSIDSTTHQSVAGFREFDPGLATAGDVTVEGFFDKADTLGQQAMLTDANAKAKKETVIEFPTTPKATWTFNGFITAIKIGDADLEGNIKFSATIKPSGKPVMAIAST